MGILPARPAVGLGPQFTDRKVVTALPGQPLGRPVLGTAQSVEAIGRDDLFAYLARHYTASNMVLSAAGRDATRSKASPTFVDPLMTGSSALN